MSIRILAVAAMAMGLALAGHVSAEEKAEEKAGGKKCVSLHSISSTKVLDNQRIKFEMDGGSDYVNMLPRKCPGLNKNTPIMYKTSLSQLCDLDTITVLNSMGGGYMPSATCGLGRFEPFVEEEKKSAE